MISWIQKTFQQHFRLIFMVLLALTIISFIFTIGAMPGISGADRTITERRVFGYNLASQDDQGRLYGDAGLSVQLQTGYQSLEGADLQNYAFQRAASLKLADDLHIPAPSREEVADSIKTLRVFSDENGQFDAARYAMFRDSLKSNPRLNENTVSRVLADDVRVEKVRKLLAGPGYVQRSEVVAQLERADATWTVATATIDYATFNPNVQVTDAALAKYFAENSMRYQVPPSVVVSYANFPATAYLSSINVTEGEVRAYYDANPARFPKPAIDPKTPPANVNPANDFAKVRPQVESSLKLDRAQRLAAKAASDFSFALYEQKIQPGTPAFEKFLADHKISLRTLAPFSHESGPAEFGGSPEIASEAFKLNKDRQYSDALTTPGGAIVLFWKENLPARDPQLAEVRVRVSADYVENEKRKRFVEFGHTLRTLIENGLKSGQSFEKAVAGADISAKVETKTLAPFTRRQPPANIDPAVPGVLETLKKGQVSDMIVEKDKGVLVYAADRKAPDLAPASQQYVAMERQIADLSGRVAVSSILNEMVTEELKRTEPVVK